MTTQNWLDLSEYSAKYKVSLSTLRRRLRFGEIENFFRDGKYWVLDQKIEKNVKSKASKSIKEVKEIQVEEQVVVSGEVNQNLQQKAELRELVGELKSAYVSVLHEKENQITQLKEEIADLKTLVKILESENERLQPPPKTQTPDFLNVNDWQLDDLDL